MVPALTVGRVCGLGSARYAVEINARTVYHNRGSAPVAIVPQSETLTGADYSRELSALAAGRAEVLERGAVVLPFDPAGPWQADQVRIVAPGGSYVGTVSLSPIVMIAPVAMESDLVLAPGHYFVRIATLLYVRSQTASATDLKDFSVLYVSGATASITIPEPKDVGPCNPPSRTQ
jgi:hypothetical protein